MTREGYDKLRAELEHLENVEMPKVATLIAQARGEGDLSENAEYHAQRENQGLLAAKINLLKHKLNSARIIDTSKVNRSEVAFGATVKVRDLDFDDEEEFTLVGAGDDDPDKGRIQVTSPLAQGLIGRKAGDTVEIPVPKGMLKFEILEIRYDELD
jgi:transcription elongation factor GreA